MSNPWPHELVLGDVYYSPLLAVLALSLVSTWCTVVVLNKLRWSRYFYSPSASFLAIMGFYLLAFDQWLIRF